MTTATADLFDSFSDRLRVAAPLFTDFGGRATFSGPVATVKIHEDNTLVRAALETAGNGAVLVIDGGASLRCALVGDVLARMGADNGWAGIIVNGCIRDSGELARIPIGIKALATHPARSEKRGEGQRDVRVTFAGVDFVPGHWLYADRDGLLVAATALG